MGERIAVRFVRKAGKHLGPELWEEPEEKSVVIYSHWGGDDYALRNRAQRWVKHLPTQGSGINDPSSRREPSALIVEFVQTEGREFVDRLLPDMKSGKGLDWGLWEIDVITGEARKK
jgi:hypothetical protein